MREFDEKQLAKLSMYREIGINPYPSGSKWKEIHNIDEALAVEKLGREAVDSFSSDMTFGCRVMFKNHLGKIGFARVRDNSGQIQVVIHRDQVSEQDFTVWKKLDIGDIITCKGNLCFTSTGEFSLNIKTLELSSKCMSGMPDKINGVTDPEICQRQRYLDLIVNESSKNVFKIRSAITKIIRDSLEEHDFMEVETPILQSIPGGANAKPFETHHNSLNQEMFLRIAPELYLKRLLVGGFPRVFEIGKNFRNEGISTRHNPEFTMVEFYWAYANYEQLIDFTKSLFIRIADYMDAYNPGWDGGLVNFRSFTTMRFSEAIVSFTDVANPWDIDQLISYSNSFNIHVKGSSISDYWSAIFDHVIEPQLKNPTFITHFPVEISPLARTNDEDPRLTDRFELFVSGKEIANGFNELNDPIEQQNRFKEQAALKAGGNDEAMYYDEDYINALSYGMPPAAGQGIGIDRLVMLFTGCDSIRDVILFPTLKRI